jgi:hypothetical protein
VTAGYAHRHGMADFPAPDPDDLTAPDGRRLQAPAAIFLKGTPSAEAERVAYAILEVRPGALFVVAPER